jgi:NAD(P)H-hydrate epimerase
VVDASAPVGRIEIVDLGAPVDAGIAPSARCRLLDAPGIAERLPRRSADAHKGSSGHLLVVAGSAGKTGAAFLVGTAALRSGAGLVTIASTAGGQIALDAKAIELMTARYTDGEDADPAPALAALQRLAERAQAVALGPGIPTGAGMRAVVHELASRLKLPMVIDADALNALGTEAPKLLSGAPAPRVLTPHPG